VAGVDATIEAHAVSKRFGKTVAVDDLSFTVRSGRVTGFVGPNGAGKSTTMRIALALDAPDRGEVLVGGRRYDRLDRPLHEVGALLDASATHPGRSARSHLRWLARSNGISRRRVEAVLELVGLAEVAHRRTGGYSLGMAQRLGIAAALLGDPQVLLLDEPINGLDPEGIRWIRGLLRELADEGRTVFVSSHLMSELEGTADGLIVIGRGRLIAETSVGELLTRMSDTRVTVRTPDAAELMRVLARAGASATSTDGNGLVVSGLEVRRIAELAVENRLQLDELAPHRTSLEDAFLELTREAVEYTAEQKT
jgi:ABC-2 type transport system ATP-binding protein